MFGSCENVSVSSTFGCLRYYSVPWSYVCNGRWDCPHGVDESDCSYSSCPGFFKCKDSRICLWSNSLCDGLTECPNGDDEHLCVNDLFVLPDCPQNCSCLLYAVVCTSVINLHSQIGFPDPHVFIKFTAMSIPETIFNHISTVVFLIITDSIFPCTFCQVFLSLNHINFLQSAEMSKDGISMPMSGCFKQFFKLGNLNLTTNFISTIHRSYFTGLSSLISLDLSANMVRNLDHRAFGYLSKLKYINLLHNEIISVDFSAFLDTNLIYAATETFQVCCLLNSQRSHEDVQCTSSPPWPSTCHNRMLRPFYRTTSYWVSGFILASNGFTFVVNLVPFLRKDSKGAFKLHLIVLYILDILYGCTLIVVPSADLHYGKLYHYYWVRVTPIPDESLLIL